MFSSDIRKIKIAELKAKGDGGTIQRLRKSCADAAAVMEHTAKLLAGKPMEKKYRLRLCNELLRGSSLLRNIARFDRPSPFDAARVADLAHKALNAKDSGTWVSTLMNLRSEARASLGLQIIPKGKKGSA